MTTKDNPRLTAYALGELNDRDRIKLEAELHSSPDMRAAVADIRAAAARIEAALASEPADALFTPSAAMQTLPPIVAPPAAATRAAWRMRWMLPAGAGVAAGLALLITTPWLKREVAIDRGMTSFKSLSDWDGSKPDIAFGTPHTDARGVTPVVGEVPVPSHYFVSPSSHDSRVDLRDARTWEFPNRPYISYGYQMPYRRPEEAAGNKPLSNPSTSRFAQVGGQPLQPYGQRADVPLASSNSRILSGFDTRQLAGSQIAELLLEIDEAQIPWHNDVLYPKNWLEISARRDRSATTSSSDETTQTFYGPKAPSLAVSDDTQPITEAERVMDDIDAEDPDAKDQIAHQVESRRELAAPARAAIIDKLFVTARKLRREKRFVDAATAMRQVLLLDPSHARALVDLEIYEDFHSLSQQLTLPKEPAPAIVENPFASPLDAPLSTFSIDVDTASYTLTRDLLSAGHLPHPAQIRIEEMLNHFEYDDAPPTGDDPIAVDVEIAACPWRPENRLARVALKGRVVEMADAPPCNLVFLIDVSGSMDAPKHLPLLKQSLALLVPQLGPQDRVSIVTYADSAIVALPPTPGNAHGVIVGAIEQLKAAGSTNGAAGIQTAYALASQNFIDGGMNRVILATDGDFNVGISDDDALANMIAEKAATGVYLSVLGVGLAIRDTKVETLADKGDGNYAYLDSVDQAHRVLVQQASGTLLTIARDVKLQVEFNPAVVSEYRLIGYENRMLGAADFNNDAVDAGELGSGHTVTALYEIVPAAPGAFAIAAARSDDAEAEAANIDPLKYQTPAELVAAAGFSPVESLTVKLRYKLPQENDSRLMSVPAFDDGATFACADGDFRFAASVAAFGMVLRNSAHVGGWSLADVAETTAGIIVPSDSDERREFQALVLRAKSLRGED